MLVYILNALSLPIYGKFFRDRKKLCILISLQIFLLMAFRNNYLGVDLGGYENTYNDIQRLSFNDIISQFSFFQTIRVNEITSVEFGYILLNWMMGRLGFSYHALLVVNAAICMVSVCFFINKYSEKPVLSFIVYIGAGPMYYSFGLLRQTIATSILLFSVDALFEKKYLKSVILMLVAILFHRSSLFILVLIIFSRIKLRKVYYIIALVASAGVIVLAPFLVKKIIFPFLLYIGKPSYANLLDNPISHLAIALWTLALLFLLLIDFDSIEDEKTNLMMWGFLLFLAIQSFSRYVSTITRFQTLFVIMTGVLLSNLIARSRIYHNQIILSVACYVFFFLYMCMAFSGSAIDPYVSVFEYMQFPNVI